MTAHSNLFLKLSEHIKDPDAITDVLKLVDLTNPMKKYFQSEKGKIAKKRAQEKWLESEKGKKVLAAQNARLKQDHTAQVKAWIGQWAAKKTDAEQYQTLTSLWKEYLMDTNVKITRKQFAGIIEQIPAFVEVNKWVDDGKTRYTPGLKIDIRMCCEL